MAFGTLLWLRDLGGVVLFWALAVSSWSDGPPRNGFVLLFFAIAATIWFICRVREAIRFAGLMQGVRDINGRDSLGRTPLHYAVANGDVPLVELLLANGAEPNAGDVTGVMPLHGAVLMKNGQIVRLLIQHGAVADDWSKEIAEEEGAVQVLALLNRNCPQTLPGEAPADAEVPELLARP